MKTKPLTFLLALTFLCSIFILTSCASRPRYKISYSKNGTEVVCNENSDNCIGLKGDPRSFDQDRLYCEVFAETGTPPPNFTRSTSDTSSKVTTHSGYITDQFGGSTYSYSGTSRTQTDQMQQGLQSMSNALGNLARMNQYEERLKNRFRKCMNIMMDYDIVRVPMPTAFYKDDKCYGPIEECEILNSLYKKRKEIDFPYGEADDLQDAFDAYERKDYETAYKLLASLAEEGVAKAQFAMGTMYFEGQGIPQDYVLAHMWWNLSTSNGHKSAIHNRNIVEKKMTKQQIEKAQEMARNWKPPSN